MGNRNTKSNLRTAIIFLNISADAVKVDNEKFWAKIWSEDVTVAAEVIKSISTQEIRMLRDGSSQNFATLTYKIVERLSIATGTLCNTQSQQTAVLNATRILTRLIPCIFEDKAWRNFFQDNQITSEKSEVYKDLQLIYPRNENKIKNFKSYLPPGSQFINSSADDGDEDVNEEQKSNHIEVDLLSDCTLNESKPLVAEESKSHPKNSKISGKSLLETLLHSVCDLLFCPEFTVSPHNSSFSHCSVDTPPEDIKALATCDYVWEPGVGFDSDVNSTSYYDKSRSELLKLLLACISATLYKTPDNSLKMRDEWLRILTSPSNRQTLPLFTSLLNTVFVYNPAKLLPFNRLLFEDTREELVELSIQILIATLDYQDDCKESKTSEISTETEERNMFIEYISRIHREADFMFLIKGFQRLLNSRIDRGYLLSSTKHIEFDQEVLVFLWKLCNLNRNFMTYILQTTDVLDIVVPILYHLNENFQNPSKSALVHIGVFNLLMLSSERNFGVRLNKPYLTNVLENIPTFTGSHADLLIIVIHKLILYGQNLNQLYDFLLTILVNISPYLKTLSLLSSKCLIQIFEIFSSPFVIFTEPHYHQVVVYLLEIFNNLIQYQFNGNAQLVCAIISKSEAFTTLANLPCSSNGIKKVLNKLIKKKEIMKSSSEASSHDENGNIKANYSETDTFKVRATVSASDSELERNSHSSGVKLRVSLVATPDICDVTQETNPFAKPKEPKIQQVSTPIEDAAITPVISLDDLLDQNEPNEVENFCSSFTKVGSNECIEETSGKQELEESSLKNEKYDNKPIYDNKTSDIPTQRWSPTADWAKQWKEALPLQTILKTIDVLKPQLERLNPEGPHNALEMIKFVQNGTLVGLLPVPHPIVIRKYRTNDATTLWFKTCIWGVIYVQNSIWTETNIRLVKIVV